MTSQGADGDVLEAGAREAAEALLRLAQRESARIVFAGSEPVSAVVERAGPRAVVVGFTVSGGLQGRFALVLADPAARALATAMTGPGRGQDGDEKLGKRALAALTELGNIAASAFMNGAAELLHQSCIPSVPSLHHGDPAEHVPAVLGGASTAEIARLDIGDIHVDVALVR